MSKRWLTVIADSLDVIMIVLASAVGLDALADERLTKRPSGSGVRQPSANELCSGFGRNEAAAAAAADI